jgi:hypothetical protein
MILNNAATTCDAVVCRRYGRFAIGAAIIVLFLSVRAMAMAIAMAIAIAGWMNSK